MSKESTQSAPASLQTQADNQPQPRHESTPGFIDETELLKRIPVCRRTLYNWIQQGKLPVVVMGRRKIYCWENVKVALLRQQRGGFDQ
jgi:hypothetical protein